MFKHSKSFVNGCSMHVIFCKFDGFDGEKVISSEVDAHAKVNESRIVDELRS